jgi:hypothetical protein
MKKNIVIYPDSEIKARTRYLESERKLGEKLRVMQTGEGLENLNPYAAQGIQSVLLGIPESVGPMANYGKCCTQHCRRAFLNAFLNMQSNRFLGGDYILCLGHIETRTLNTEAELLDKTTPDSIQKLRSLCARLDDQVFPVIESIVQAGWILKQVLRFFKGLKQSAGIELNMDGIVNMPASAMTPGGFTVEEARKFMRAMAVNRKRAYLHLPGGAPSENSAEMLTVGKTLAYLVADFIRFNCG